jgi:GNAT superfamily N-acetyltransferase
MITIRQASIPDDRDAVRDLFAEYLGWACPRIYEEYGAVFDPESILAREMATLDIFMPPNGLLSLAFENGAPAGCTRTRTRTLGDGIAELKRMYVQPSFRRRGAGRLLVDASVQAARESDYSVMRLDSAGFMTDAHALYRACSFRDCSPYEGSEIPPEYQRYWVFMELDLGPRT